MTKDKRTLTRSNELDPLFYTADFCFLAKDLALGSFMSNDRDDAHFQINDQSVHSDQVKTVPLYSLAAC